MNDATEQQILKTFADDVIESVATIDPDSALLDRYFEQGDLSPALLATLQTLAARPLEELFRYCFEGQVMDAVGLRRAARRFVSVAWLLHSEMMIGEDEKIMTLERLSKLPQLSCTRCAMSILARDFGKRFNFRGRVQKRQGSKENYAAAARKGWEKRERPKPQQVARKCRRCHEVKPVADFKARAFLCNDCRALPKQQYPKPPRACGKCKVVKPADQFDPKMRACRSCRSQQPPIGSPR